MVSSIDMDQAPFKYCAQLYFQQFIMHIACDMRPGMEFKIFTRRNGPANIAINHQMRHIDVAFDPPLFAQHQRTRLSRRGDHIAVHMTVNTHSTAEADISIDDCPGSYQRIDTVLQLSV